MRLTAKFACRAAMAVAFAAVCALNANAATKASKPGMQLAAPKSAVPAGPPPAFSAPPAALPGAAPLAPLSDEWLDGFGADVYNSDGTQESIEFTGEEKIRLRDKRSSAPVPPAAAKLARVSDTSVLPYSATGWVNNTFCAGSVVFGKYVLTGAYCVWNVQEQKLIPMDKYYPATHGDKQPFAPVAWKKIYVPKGFKKNGDLEYNYALIELEQDIGENTGWYGLAVGEGGKGAKFTLLGYPGEGEAKDFTMWEAPCKLAAEERGFLFYGCSGKAQSINEMYGGPLLRKGDDGWYIVGFNGGFERDRKDSFWGMQVTEAMAASLKKWAKAEDLKPGGGGEGENEEEEDVADGGDDDEEVVTGDCDCEKDQ